MQKWVTFVINMMKREKLYASQGGPIIMSQIENEYNHIQFPSIVRSTHATEGTVVIPSVDQTAPTNLHCGLKTGLLNKQSHRKTRKRDPCQARHPEAVEHSSITHSLNHKIQPTIRKPSAKTTETNTRLHTSGKSRQVQAKKPTHPAEATQNTRSRSTGPGKQQAVQKPPTAIHGSVRQPHHPPEPPPPSTRDIQKPTGLASTSQNLPPKGQNHQPPPITPHPSPIEDTNSPKPTEATSVAEQRRKRRRASERKRENRRRGPTSSPENCARNSPQSLEPSRPSCLSKHLSFRQIEIRSWERYGNVGSSRFSLLSRLCSSIPRLVASVRRFLASAFNPQSPRRLVFCLSLETLTLGRVNICSRDDIMFIFCLLRSSPNLKTLNISIEYNEYNDDEDEASVKCFEAEGIIGYNLSQLLTVKIAGLTGLRCETMLVNIMLSSCPLLKTLHTELSSNIQIEKEAKMAWELNRCHRLSSDVELMYSNSKSKL
ncbi:hypothetical protein QQ045_005431 [Rhodiola kirilowii]